ncbi:MAG TPA: iron dependent repressor, metal binding and dimerization domain protein [Rubrobacter sp.]|nr:iron dependent repressor, metal binding and dimerization domain protein [Rubrobacter sp.]
MLDQLGYSWEDVHEEAEKLEHAVSDRFTERLAELLGHPDHDPHGDPIPAVDGTLEPDGSFPSRRRRQVSAFSSLGWATRPPPC